MKTKGYKAFLQNEKGELYTQPKDERFYFKVGETYKIDGNVEICESGFHYCDNIKDCFRFYPLLENTVICIVQGSGVIKKSKDLHMDGEKYASEKIKILKQLTEKDIIKALDNNLIIDSGGIDYSNYISNSSGVNHSRNVYLSFGIRNSSLIMRSEAVETSRYIKNSIAVRLSQHVIEGACIDYSRQVVNSDNVKDSNGIYLCQNITNSEACEVCFNVSDAYFCIKCKNAYNLLFCYDIENTANRIFNKKVSVKRFNQILGEFKVMLGDAEWEIVRENEKNLLDLEVSKDIHNEKRELINDKLLKYLKRLREFNLEIFNKIIKGAED